MEKVYNTTMKNLFFPVVRQGDTYYMINSIPNPLVLLLGPFRNMIPMKARILSNYEVDQQCTRKDVGIVGTIAGGSISVIGINLARKFMEMNTPVSLTVFIVFIIILLLLGFALLFLYKNKDGYQKLKYEDAKVKVHFIFRTKNGVSCIFLYFICLVSMVLPLFLINESFKVGYITTGDMGVIVMCVIMYFGSCIFYYLEKYQTMEIIPLEKKYF